MRYIKKVSAEKQVRVFLENTGTGVFAFDAISAIIDNNRNAWDLAPTVPVVNLVNRFVSNNILREVVIDFDDERKLTRYLYGEPTVYEIATSLHPKSYISHYPAVFLHGLTTQVPKNIYTTSELSPKLKKPADIEQEAIDRAFSLPQRRSETKAVYGDYNIILLSGMYTARSGVIAATKEKGSIAMTGLERTLIDITVRPNYSGGAFAVLEAYRRAKEAGLSVNKLLALLDKIGYIYPYHQSMGFYLERAGYATAPLAALRNKPMPFKFYLDYQLTDKQYDENWKIYYPKGM